MFTKARVLLCIGLLCFMPFFVPTFHRNTIPNGTEERFTLGLPQSPWFVHTSTETNVEVKAEGVSSSSMNSGFSAKVELIAWSWLFAIAGTALIAASRRLKTRETPMPT